MTDEASGEVEKRLRGCLAEGADASAVVEELLRIRQTPEGERLMAQVAEPLLRKHHVNHWVPIRGSMSHMRTWSKPELSVIAMAGGAEANKNVSCNVEGIFLYHAFGQPAAPS